MRRRLVAGNWKLHGAGGQASALTHGITQGVCASEVELAVFPPYPYLPQLARALDGHPVNFGAQDVSQFEEGAYTGEVSAEMVMDFGAVYALVGHSERRQLFAETDEIISTKWHRAAAASLTPILCIGETEGERDAGQTESALARQLDAVFGGGHEFGPRTVIAYEPIWAIGTGRSATPAQAQEAHAFIRRHLAKDSATIADSLQILYGGSVKPANAADLAAEDQIDGALVGGASLDAADFLAIWKAFQS